MPQQALAAGPAAERRSVGRTHLSRTVPAALVLFGCLLTVPSGGIIVSYAGAEPLISEFTSADLLRWTEASGFLMALWLVWSAGWAAAVWLKRAHWLWLIVALWGPVQIFYLHSTASGALWDINRYHLHRD